jgi:signal transduction histidine kinase
MKKPRASFLRGLSAQLLAFTVFPLTLLLLLIAFGSVSLHQRDMRALVGERDERAVQSAASALSSELHHRAASISDLAALAQVSTEPSKVFSAGDMGSDFDGGLAYLDGNGHLLAVKADSRGFWDRAGEYHLTLAADSEPGPIFSSPFPDPGSGQYFVIVSQSVPSRQMIVAGAFSPARLAADVLSASYPANDPATVYLVDTGRQLIFSQGAGASQTLPQDHPGLAEALRGETGTIYIQQDELEHVVAYGPIPLTGWALITEEEWEKVISPSLQVTQMAPLVLVPAFLLALLALWFVARRIVQPLQKLETQAAALAWGDFEAIKEPVGGISEVQHLQLELGEMSRKVQAAQEGLHYYIGAITSAQEEERLRLARELHDDTIQSVIALKQRVQLAQKSVKDPAAWRTLQELEMLSEQTIDGLRRMTRALRPIYLEDLGLVTALEMLVREMGQNSSLDIDFRRTGEEKRLSPEVEVALYRIAQEALSNVARHARAKSARLRLDFGVQQITLEVSDDGIGFEMPRSPTDFAPNGHFGLLGMRERADLIGGRLDVQSKPGEGTRLSVRLP